MNGPTGLVKSVLLLTAAAWAGGCVEREMTITTNPPGARVFVSDVEVGTTPLTMPFTWYGDYDILIRCEGYNTLRTHAMIAMPAYEIPPVDLLSELAPWTYHDRRYLHYELQKAVEPTDQELLEGAEALDKRLQQPVKH
ncbi:MAG: PEGA domain-containing protein [Phycisphaerae bacterium]